MKKRIALVLLAIAVAVIVAYNNVDVHNAIVVLFGGGYGSAEGAPVDLYDQSDPLYDGGQNDRTE